MSNKLRVFCVGLFMCVPGVTSAMVIPATTSPMISIQLSVRSHDSLFGPYTVSLPSGTTTSVTSTNSGTQPIASDSALAALVTETASTSDYTISDLEYYASYHSLYLKCMTLAGTSTPTCDSWNYQVNGSSPAVGSDQKILSDGDNVIFYDNTPHQVVLSATTTSINASFSATAERYVPSSNTFAHLTGVILGVTQPNPSDPYNPIEVATSTVDSNGTATFSLATAGTYQVGIQDDGYYPSLSITVNTPPSGGSGSLIISTSTATTTTATSTSPQTFDITRALSFLTGHENSDGSFSDALRTDWAALALAAGHASSLSSITSYLRSHTVSLSSVTDYERHAIALESVGVDPYTGSPQSTIAPIVRAFDGTQIGDPSQDNDDIFALIALTHAGFTQNDTMIRKIATFVIGHQLPNGSWDNSSDMTAAAIQALGPLYTIPGYGQSLGQASGYLMSTQQSDGGWGSIDSTSWVKTAINSINNGDPSHAITPTNNGKTAMDALAASQQSDGGVQPVTADLDTRVWSTSYAIVAASGDDWISLLQSFGRGNTNTAGGSSGVTSNSTSSVATTTASTTKPTIPTPSATSTQPVGVVLGVSTTTQPSIRDQVDALLAEIFASSTSQTPTRTPKHFVQHKVVSIPHQPTTDTVSTSSQPKTKEPGRSWWRWLTGFFSSN